jgi:predicted GNAT family acetyltransferase
MHSTEAYSKMAELSEKALCSDFETLNLNELQSKEDCLLTSEQRDIIKQWKKYGADLMVYCEELLEYGFGGE